jgi:outer membrane protein assembly factor BamB
VATVVVTAGAPLALAAGVPGVVPGCRPAWPAFQANPLHTAAGCSTTISPVSTASLRPAWFAPTAGQVTAEPVVVAGAVYVGDGAGIFRSLDAATGRTRWMFDILRNRWHDDRHNVSYGEIASSAAYATVRGLGPLVVFGGGGSVWALNPVSGRPRWVTDLDPAHPAGPVEAESSPVVWTPRHGRPEVLIGSDVNESAPAPHTGLFALDARTGRLLWKFDPETGRVSHTLATSAIGYGCGDVWSSPALDPDRGLVLFGTGNCNQPGVAQAEGGLGRQAVYALDARTGARVWAHPEPVSRYTYDDDFGSSVLLVRVGGRTLAIQGGKSGFMYALDEATGRLIWKVQPAQPGQSGAFAGAIGGFIGSLALGRVDDRLAVFGTTAIPLPFQANGPAASNLDPSLAGDPTRTGSLHAVDVSTGRVLWQQPLATASYAPATYCNGVVFAPATTNFTVNAYAAATGLPLWRFPVGAAVSGGMVIAGGWVYVGAGTYLAPGANLPPQETGVWAFRPAG